jgi:hypothetical protein
VEVDLHDIVSANTYKHFAGDIKKKEMARRKAAHEAVLEKEREREREEKEKVPPSSSAPILLYCLLAIGIVLILSFCFLASPQLSQLRVHEFVFSPEDFEEALPSPSDYPSAFPPALSSLSSLSSAHSSLNFSAPHSSNAIHSLSSPPPPSFAQVLASSKRSNVTPTVTNIPKGRKGRQKIFSTVSQRAYK